jgi:hypothetical protein
MRGATDIANAIHHLRMAYDHFESFGREYPGTQGARLCKQYSNRIEWVVNDMLTHPHFPAEVREGIRSEWMSDVFTGEAIREKIVQLNPTEREVVERLIDAVIAGERIEIEHV